MIDTRGWPKGITANRWCEFGHREEHRALVYRDPVEEEGKPKGAYVGRMNAAIDDAQLSPDYVKHVIRAFIPLH